MRVKILSSLIISAIMVGCGGSGGDNPTKPDGGSLDGAVLPDMSCTKAPVTVQVLRESAPVSNPMLLVFADPQGNTTDTVLTPESGAVTVSVCPNSSVTLANLIDPSPFFEKKATDISSIPIPSLYILQTIMNLDPAQQTPYVFNLIKPSKETPDPAPTTYPVVVTWPKGSSGCGEFKAAAVCEGSDRSTGRVNAQDGQGPYADYCVVQLGTPENLDEGFPLSCVTGTKQFKVIVERYTHDDVENADILVAAGMQSDLTAAPIVIESATYYSISFTAPISAPKQFAILVNGGVPGMVEAYSTPPFMIWGGQGIKLEGQFTVKPLASGSSTSVIVQWLLPAAAENFDLVFTLGLTPEELKLGDIFNSEDKTIKIPSLRHAYGYVQRIPQEVIATGSMVLDLTTTALPTVSQPMVTLEGWPSRVHFRWSEDQVVNSDPGVRADVRTFYTMWVNELLSSVNMWIVFSNPTKTMPPDLVLPAMPSGLLGEYLPAPDTQVVLSGVALMNMQPKLDTVDAAYAMFLQSFGYSIPGRVAKDVRHYMSTKNGLNINQYFPSGAGLQVSLAFSITIPPALMTLIIDFITSKM